MVFGSCVLLSLIVLNGGFMPCRYLPRFVAARGLFVVGALWLSATDCTEAVFLAATEFNQSVWIRTFHEFHLDNSKVQPLSHLRNDNNPFWMKAFELSPEVVQLCSQQKVHLAVYVVSLVVGCCVFMILLYHHNFASQVNRKNKPLLDLPKEALQYKPRPDNQVPGLNFDGKELLVINPLTLFLSIHSIKTCDLCVWRETLR